MEPAASGITSIELLLDEAAEARIRAEWEALAAAGMSSMAGHEAASNRPHVTLLARRTPVPRRLRLSAMSLPLPLQLGPPLLFGDGDRRVLARSIVPTAGLLALQHAVLVAVGGGGDDERAGEDAARHEHAPRDDAEHFAPGRWTPHVTLARRIRLVDLPGALRLLGPPIDAQGVTLRRWDAATATVSRIDLG
ncbi:2'-5' RNA ligase family protein [Agrococcus sp. Ld7]|uniref:2'-5' RNA ligase family protein n=1 Tax=Agrococcus sp. Ld7 TaxID=649148 RepID=UPI00386308E5